MRWTTILLATFFSILAVAPAPASAQPTPTGRGSDVLVRINGPAIIPAGDSNSVVAVINDTAVIDGTVGQTLLVINGTAIVRGVIRDNLVVLNGHAILENGSRVKDVQLYGSTITRNAGAVVTGRVEQESMASIGRGAAWLFWVSVTIVALVLGLFVIAFMGRQLAEATQLFVSSLWPVVLTSLIVWIGLPLLAVLCFITVIGIPLGLTIFIGIMPILWFLGYVVASLVLGGAILHSRWQLAQTPTGRRFSEAIIGILLFQLIYLIPAIGGLIVMVASWLGSGALVLRSWRRWKEDRETGVMEPSVPPLPISPTPG